MVALLLRIFHEAHIAFHEKKHIRFSVERDGVFARKVSFAVENKCSKTALGIEVEFHKQIHEDLLAVDGRNVQRVFTIVLTHILTRSSALVRTSTRFLDKALASRFSLGHVALKLLRLSEVAKQPQEKSDDILLLHLPFFPGCRVQHSIVSVTSSTML